MYVVVAASVDGDKHIDEIIILNLYNGVVVREVGGSALFHRGRPSPPIAAATASAAAVIVLGSSAKCSVFRLMGGRRERKPTLPKGM